MFKIITGICILFSFLLLQGVSSYDLYSDNHLTSKSQQPADDSESGSEKEKESNELKNKFDDFIHYNRIEHIHSFYSKSLPFYYLLPPIPSFAATIWTPPKTFA
jgi:hypothetical protein